MTDRKIFETKSERKRGEFGFLPCFATMSRSGPGVLFQYNGREKSSIIPGKREKKRERGEREKEMKF